jgi:hypothetical protein
MGMRRRASTATIVRAMRILSEDIQSGDGVANAAIAEAADRLEELVRDITTVIPSISVYAGQCNARTKAGREFRAAANRLAAEVLAPSKPAKVAA